MSALKPTCNISINSESSINYFILSRFFRNCFNTHKWLKSGTLDDIFLIFSVILLRYGWHMAIGSNKILAELVSKAVKGDEDAWMQIVTLITPTILGLCRKMSLTRDEAYDVFGQVCYNLLNGIKSLRDTEKLISFTITTTRNEILSLLGKRRVLGESLTSIDIDTMPGREKLPIEVVEQISEREMLIGAIAKLPPQQARLIIYLFLDPDEPSYTEIARKLEMPVSSIGPIRAKSLKKLRTVLKRAGYNFMGIFLVLW